MATFFEDIEPILQRRESAVTRIDFALNHLSRFELVTILTSYIPIDELEAALPTICGGNSIEDAAIAADFAAFGKNNRAKS